MKTLLRRYYFHNKTRRLSKSSTAAKINSNGAHEFTPIGVKIAALDGAMLSDLPERS